MLMTSTTCSYFVQRRRTLDKHKYTSRSPASEDHLTHGKACRRYGEGTA